MSAVSTISKKKTFKCEKSSPKYVYPSPQMLADDHEQRIAHLLAEIKRYSQREI